MNPFQSLSNIQNIYKSYVYTFQKVKNPVIKGWINEKLSEGGLLWKEPYIQLNRKFERGASLESLVESEILHKQVLNIFTKRENNKLIESPIIPYKHQSDAISSILNNSNTIITSGTSSGKSFCFGIPIVSECLKMKEQGIKGVKAVIVYPMNALANSQYEDFAERLEGSGLKIALYTGDTQNNREQAIEVLKASVGREPFDSEIISREEIHNNPPDILMTNYVMLDLIITRFEDQKIFPESHKGVLKFLVLDEIHTYSGKKGADVACLIRRIKELTESFDKLRCIGTSATVQSYGNEHSSELVAKFATHIFGEKFNPLDIVEESHIKPVYIPNLPLPEKILITKDLIREFDGSLQSAIRISSVLLNQDIQVNNFKQLGNILSQQTTIQFLQKKIIFNFLFII